MIKFFHTGEGRGQHSFGLDSGYRDGRTGINTIISLHSSMKKIILVSPISSGYLMRYLLKLSVD